MLRRYFSCRVRLKVSHDGCFANMAALLICLMILSWIPSSYGNTFVRKTFYVQENQPAGTIIGNVTLTGSTSYSKIQGSQSLSVNTTTGIIYTTQSLDREKITPTLSLEIQISPSNTIVFVTVHVSDVNDNAPLFPQQQVAVTISESVPINYTQPITAAQDPDAGVNGTITYSIQSGNVDHVFGLRVTRAGNNDLLSLVVEKLLDRERHQFYRLTILALDGGQPPLNGSMIVNVSIADANDNRPVFINQSTYAAVVAENVAVGSPVTRVYATDADIGSNAAIVYSLITPGVPFTMNSGTGEIRTSGQLNYETRSSYILTVGASNQGAGNSPSTAFVNITVKNVIDNPPSIDLTYYNHRGAYINENAAIDTKVINVGINNIDAGSSISDISVTMAGGDNHFRLNTTSTPGTWLVVLNQKLDRETRSQYTLNITAQYKNRPDIYTSKLAVIQVEDVNDNAPVFTQSVYHARVNESVTIGTYVTQVVATDKDSGINAKLTYSIESGLFSNLFSINATTGIIVTSVQLDREVKDQVLLTVKASDGVHSTTTKVNITILDANDNPPYFAYKQYSGEISEGASINTIVLTVRAVDPDVINNQIRYSMSLSHGTTAFTVGSTNGVIRTAQLLDREKVSQYSFDVVATDGGGKSSSVPVTIDVSDINDNKPVFYPLYYNVVVRDIAPIGQRICTLSATDADSGNNAKIRFRFISPLNTQYTLNDTTGQIFVAKKLNHTVQNFTVLMVEAIDGGNLASASNANVSISIVGTDQQPPTFNQSIYNFTMLENQPIDTFIGTVHANTNGHGTTGRVSYAITDGDPQHQFTINQTGAISSAKDIDRESTQRFTLTVKAGDDGLPPLYGQTLVNILIYDVNDNPPQFLKSSDAVQIREDASIGTIVYQAIAYDRDSNQNETITYGIVNDYYHTFSIDRTNGTITLKQQLNRENVTSITLNITATDNGTPSLLSWMQLVVNVIDINDNDPQFVQQNAVVNISETTKAGQTIYQVKAYDQDIGSNAKLTYKIVNATQANLFDIDPNDGNITIQQPLDHENRSIYIVTVQAKDGGIPPRMATMRLEVHVIDENDNSPQFLQSSYTFKISQDQPANTKVGQIEAKDDDSGTNAKITYSLIALNDGPSNFTIQPETGVIYTKTVLDRLVQSLFNFTGLGKDNGKPGRNGTTQVFIIVSDSNQNKPVFDNDVYSVQLAESVPVGTFVVKVHANDNDDGSNGQITYAIVAGNTNNAFAINSTTGIITTNNKLDAENLQSYKLNVTANDGGATTRIDSSLVMVNVTDINDNLPTFQNQKVTVAIKDNVPLNTTIATVTAVDPDITANAIVYTIISGNVDDTFVIGKEGYLINVKALSYGVVQRYTLLIQATDGYGNRQIITRNTRPDIVEVTIDVISANDNSPVFSLKRYFFGVTENAPLNSLVDCVKATDNDAGKNGEIIYGIVSQTPDMKHFTINKTSGCIYTNAPIDHEQQYKYDLVVSAKDQPANASQQRSNYVNVQIWVSDQNDNAPRFLGTSNIFVVNEDESIGTAIGQIIAVDDDSRENNDIVYNIVLGNNAGKFALDAVNGVLKIAAKLDFEKRTNYSLNISATDKGTPPKSSYKAITVYVVDVNDHAPVFTKSIYYASVKENTPINTLVTTVTATDKDTGNNAKIIYSIPAGILNDTFHINAQTGKITTLKILDREDRAQYFLTVDAHDSAIPAKFSSTQVIITVNDMNDNAPIFKNNNHTFYVPENFPPTKIDKIVAVDNDMGKNGQITYSIVNGNVDQSFTINANSGELSTTKSLNREKNSKYILVIMAKDKGDHPLNSTTNATIYVTDQNDHDPVFSKTKYNTTVMESVPINTTVLTVHATDADIGSNQIIRYSIIGNSNVHKAFSIDSVSGRIATAARLDRETQSRYNFVVNASDMSPFGIRTAVVPVEVEVSDINDNIPTFTQIPYVVNITSSTAVQTVIATVHAVDRDMGQNAKILYSFQDPNNKFSIDATTGVITTIAALTDKPNYKYTIKLIATDQGVPELKGTGYLEVNVGSVSNNSPYFDPRFVSATVPENSPRNTFVTQVQVSNQNLQGVTYSLASGNDGNAFTIDSSSGAVTVLNGNELDYEERKSFQLVVVASVNLPPVTNGYLTLLINVTDVNDNRPRFKHEYYHLKVDESTQAGMAIYPIVATDADSDSFAIVRYEIVSGNLGDTFGISERSGQLYTLKKIDYEKYPSFDLIIKAYDKNDTTLYSTTSVRITIIDMNDSPPLFHYVPPVNVSENTQVGTIVAFVTASDADIRSKLTYSFKKDGNGNDTFSIDTFRGYISLAKNLDYEQDRNYELTIIATDQVQTAETILIINVLDYNDNPPVFVNRTYQTQLKEFTPPDHAVVTVKAIDQDSGNNGEIIYSLVTPTDLFYINATSGIVYTNKTVQYNPLQSVMQLVIMARDKGNSPLSALAPVRIAIIDVNDKAPVFDLRSYTRHVPENVLVGTEVLQVHAKDGDKSRKNSMITYRIISGNEYKSFAINSSTGVIKVNKPLNRTIVRDYVLTIEATDQGTPPQSGYVKAFIVVDDANNFSPRFDKSRYDGYATVHAKPGQVIVTVHAVDRDGGGHDHIMYSIFSGNEKELFTIHSTSGAISINKLLTKANIGTYNLIVSASDKVTVSPKNSTVQVVITIIFNPITPSFTELQYTGQVVENSPIGQTILTVVAIVPNASKITYSISSNQLNPNESNHFTIGSTSGAIILAKVVDAERQSLYNITVLAKDNYTPPGISSVPVYITVIGVDEYLPTFVKTQYYFKVPADAKNGQVVGQVVATDKDHGKGGEIFYYFAGGKTMGYILDRLSGKLTLNQTGNFPSKEQQMFVKAARSYNSTKYAITTVTTTLNSTCPLGGCTALPFAQQTWFIVGISLTIPAIIIIGFALICFVRKKKYCKRFKRSSNQGSINIGEDYQTGQNCVSSHTVIRGGNASLNIHQIHNVNFVNDSSSSGRGSSESNLNNIGNDEHGMSLDGDYSRNFSSLPTNLDSLHEDSVRNVHGPLGVVNRGATDSYRDDIASTLANITESSFQNYFESIPSTHDFAYEGGGEYDGQEIDTSVASLLGSLEENDYDDDGVASTVSSTKPLKHNSNFITTMIKQEELHGGFNPNFKNWIPKYESLGKLIGEIKSSKEDPDSNADHNSSSSNSSTAVIPSVDQQLPSSIDSTLYPSSTITPSLTPAQHPSTTSISTMDSQITNRNPANVQHMRPSHKNNSQPSNQQKFLSVQSKPIVIKTKPYNKSQSSQSQVNQHQRKRDDESMRLVQPVEQNIDNRRGISSLTTSATGNRGINHNSVNHCNDLLHESDDSFPEDYKDHSGDDVKVPIKSSTSSINNRFDQPNSKNWDKILSSRSTPSASETSSRSTTPSGHFNNNDKLPRHNVNQIQSAKKAGRHSSAGSGHESGSNIVFYPNSSNRQGNNEINKMKRGPPKSQQQQQQRYSTQIELKKFRTPSPTISDSDTEAVEI